jgi:hypothetical protein
MATARLQVRLLEGPMPPGTYSLVLSAARHPGLTPSEDATYPLLSLVPGPETAGCGIALGPGGISQLSHTAGRISLVCFPATGPGLVRLTLAVVEHAPRPGGAADAIVKAFASYWAGAVTAAAYRYEAAAATGGGGGGGYKYRHSAFNPKRAAETEELANHARRILLLASTSRAARGSVSHSVFRATKAVEVVNGLACDMAALAGQ